MNSTPSPDKAGKSYWDAQWDESAMPLPVDPDDHRLNNYVNRSLHNYFINVFKNRNALELLEIGCANSVWLSYFHQYHGFKVTGVDYSNSGCEKSRYILAANNVEGTVFCADIFSPPESLLGRFDVVVSFGVVEHFTDSVACIKSCTDFLKPGGRLITMVPNMCGLPGLLQKLVDRAVYDIHVPFDKNKFRHDHENAGLTVLDCNYFLPVNLSAIASGRFENSLFNPALRRLFSISSKLIWALDQVGIKIRPNKFSSPYLICNALKKA